MKWFDEIFFPSLVERYKKSGKFKLSDKQERICTKYMKETKNPNFCQEYKGYGIYMCHYSSKNPLKWKNGIWFEKLW